MFAQEKTKTKQICHCQSVCAGKYGNFSVLLFAKVNSLYVMNEMVAYASLQGQYSIF